jgi:glycosyltransferase involved in cell wall biosynthesis
MDLSVVILTWNEEQNLPRCLESVAQLGCPVHVVDSGSTDETCAIAARYGASLVEHAFRTHSEQWDWAMRNLPLDIAWVLGLDSDQSLTPELIAELKQVFSGPVPEDIDGYYLTRRQIFRGQWIKHGGYYPKHLLKIFRRDKVFFDPNDLLDHHFYVPGRTAILKHDLIEDNRKEQDLGFWMHKHIRYADLVAREEYRRRNDSGGPLKPSLFGNPDQRGLALRAGWRKMPLYVRPALYFCYRYIARFGWIDGRQGFLFHFLHAFWFRVLVDANLEEILSAAGGAMPRTGD